MYKQSKERWICFKTNSREEFLATNKLLSKGFNVILPYYIKTVRHSRKKYQVKSPIFPSYGFIKYDGDLSSLYKIKYSVGVKYYLKQSNGLPQLVPKDIINSIQSLRQKDGSYKLNPERFKKGDEVNVIEGVLTGIKAIFKEQVDEWRSRLLINFLGRISEVGINSQMIEKA